MTPVNRLRPLPTSIIRDHNAAAGRSYAAAAIVAAGALAATALLNRHLAKKAEHDNPPAGVIHQTATGEVMAAINEVAGNGP